MSSRTPDECVAVAVDESADAEEREDAIHALKMANECDELAEIATSGAEERYRREALQSLATRQCASTLEMLVEEGSLDGSLREEAADLLGETGGDG